MAEKYENKDFCLMVVDDDGQFLENVSTFLKNRGFNVLMAENGERALKLFSERKIDIAIIDYRMPEMSGEELIAEIRKVNNDTVIMLSTAYPEEKPKIETLEELDIQTYYDKREGAHSILEKIIGAKKVSIQIRKNKEQYDELLQSRARLADIGLILSGVSHNLASPAGIINLAVFNAMSARDNLDKLLLKEDIIAKEDFALQSTILSKCHTAIKNKAMYILDMMDAVSKQAFAKSQYPVSFNLNDALKRVLLLLDCEINWRRCDLERNIKISEDTQIHGISVNLVQVINNLILNAADARNGERAPAELAAYEKDGNIIISVKDYGTGIPKNVADRLFKEPVTTKEREGSGIGLYVSYNTVKKHFQGEMWFETKEGEGATFFISLPIYIAPPKE